MTVPALPSKASHTCTAHHGVPRQWIVSGEILNVKASVSITSNQKYGYKIYGNWCEKSRIDRNYQESGGLAGVGSCSGGRLEDLCQVCIGDLINDGNYSFS